MERTEELLIKLCAENTTKVEMFSANFIAINITSGVEQITQELAVRNLSTAFPYLQRIREEIIVSNYLNKWCERTEVLNSAS